MKQSTNLDRNTELHRKTVRLSLNKETLHNLADEQNPDSATHNGCTATSTCIITGHPCPPPCG
jgi:hypothetical protein